MVRSHVVWNVVSVVVLCSSWRASTFLHPSVTRWAGTRQARRLGFVNPLFARSEDDAEGNGDSYFDVESARRKLEALIVKDATGSVDGSQEAGDVSPQRSSTMSSLFDLLFRSRSQNDDEKTDHQTFSSSSPSLSPSFTLQFEPKELMVLGKPLRDALLAKESRRPLTTMERERREAEIQLLSRLSQTDEPQDDLWNLWFHERGTKPAKVLRQAESFMTNPTLWHQSEKLLLELVAQYGITWAEPVNRLATLYYMQGRLFESEKLCRVVLSIKPWHFGALSGLVMVYASMHEIDKAKEWAARRLPTLPPPPQQQKQQQQQQQQQPPMATPQQQHQQHQDNNREGDKAPIPSQSSSAPSNRRRKMWVHNATEQAERLLHRMQSESDAWWGASDYHQDQVTNKMKRMMNFDHESNNFGNDADAWQ